MARQRMVTRTVDVNTYTVMTCDTESAEVRNVDFRVGTLPKNADTLRHLKKLYETNTIKLVAIVNQHSETVLYGMPEEDFVKYAVVLPPRPTNE